MEDIKLQLGCFLILLLPIIRYQRLARHLGIKQSKIYLRLQLICMIEIIFDGLSAWTVNHINILPNHFNDIVHWVFYISLMVVVHGTFCYLLSIIHGDFRKQILYKVSKIALFTALVGMTASMPMVYYVEGDITFYSMGLPVYIIYTYIILTLIVYFGVILNSWNDINKYVRSTSMNLFWSLATITTVQCYYPEALLTSIVPTFILLSSSLYIEDPRTLYLAKKSEDLEKELEDINKRLSDNYNKIKEVAPSKTITLYGTTQDSISIDEKDFIAAEAEGNYITITYYDKNKEIKASQLRQTMKQLEIMLADSQNLIRVHRAFIVNINHVKGVEGNSQGYRISIDGYKSGIPVSRSFTSAFSKAIS